MSWRAEEKSPGVADDDDDNDEEEKVLMGSENGVAAARDAMRLALALAPPSITTWAFENNDAFCGDVDDEAFVDREGLKGLSMPNDGVCCGVDAGKWTDNTRWYDEEKDDDVLPCVCAEKADIDWEGRELSDWGWGGGEEEEEEE